MECVRRAVKWRRLVDAFEGRRVSEGASPYILGMIIQGQDVVVVISDGSTNVLGFKPILMLVIATALYLLPSFLAFKRETKKRWRILGINLFLGWTLIGWIVAMVMTLRYEPPGDDEEPDHEHIPGTPRD